MSYIPGGTVLPETQLSIFFGLSHHGQSTPRVQLSQGLASLQNPAPTHSPKSLRQNGGMHSQWQLEVDHRPFLQPSAGPMQGYCCCRWRWAVAIVAMDEMRRRRRAMYGRRMPSRKEKTVMILLAKQYLHVLPCNTHLWR